MTYYCTDGNVAACVDVLQITNAAISMVNPLVLIAYFLELSV